MKKNFWLLVLTSITMFTVVSCDKNDDNGGNDKGNIDTANSIFILNGGKYGGNNSSLDLYDVSNKTVTTNYFRNKNGVKLGDTAQDIIIYGSKIYISLYNSGVIFVTDLNGEIIEQIKHDTYNSPRYLSSSKGNVYATYFDGALAKIDTTDLSMTTIPTGANPEELDIVNNKVYVAISEGMNYPNYGKTVEVYDATNLSKIKTIDVAINPTKLSAAPNGDVYVMSMGDYGANPSVLQCIDTNDNVSTVNVTDVAGANPTLMTIGNDGMLYVVAGVSNASTNWKMVGDVYKYNTNNKTSAGKFITDGTVVDEMYSISVNTNNNDIYVGTSDYATNGDLYMFSADGKKYNVIEVGVNPMSVVNVNTTSVVE